jgi:hypothetical protein
MTAEMSPLATLQLRCAVDPAYRATVLSDPRAAMADLGVAVPDSVSVRVVESTDTELLIPLPPAQDADLTGEQLEQAAGGSLGVVLQAFALGAKLAAPYVGAGVVGGVAVGGAAYGIGKAIDNR